MFNQAIELVQMVEWFVVPVALVLIRLWAKHAALDKSVSLIQQRIETLERSMSRTEEVLYHAEKDIEKLKWQIESLKK